MARSQKELPTMETPSIPEVEEAAEKYSAARDKRMKALESEINLKAALIEHMHNNKLTRYQFDGQVVELVPGKEKVKVSPLDQETGDED